MIDKTNCPAEAQVTIEELLTCECCLAPPSHYEVRIDDQLIGTCEGLEFGNGAPRIIGYEPLP